MNKHQHRLIGYWAGWKCINPGCTTKKYLELTITDIIDKNKNNRLIESIINNSLLSEAEKTNLWMGIER